MPKYILTDAEVKLNGYLSDKNISSYSDSFVTTMKRMTVSPLF